MTNNPKIIPVNPSTTEPVLGESINVNQLPNKTIVLDSTKLLQEEIKTTLDVCIKEWEEKGWKVSNNTKHIVIKFTDNPTDGFIHISRRFEKTYIRCVLSYDLIHLLSKTLKALEVEDGK